MERIEIINQWNLQRIFTELECGNMRIPRFQRAYVWEPSKIVKLLGSIYNQYPIGSFFIWETDANMSGFCRDITDFGFPKNPEANKFTFILDGQQRITSLYVALKGKQLNGVDYRRICFNVEKQVFKIPTLKTEPHNIPVWQIFDNAECMKLVVKYTQENKVDFVNAIMKCQNTFNTYPVSIIKSMDMGLDEVVTIFERINQGGKRLSLFDLVHASVWSEDFDLRDQITAFNSEKAISIFGRLDQEVFTQSLALNISGDCVKTHQLALKNEDCKAIWEKTLECIRLTIDFIKKQFGVQNVSIIPYQNIIPILQYYFFVSESKGIIPEHKQMISDWFWTVTFSNRYSSSTLTKMKDDAKWITEIIDGSSKPRIFTVKLGLDDLKKVSMQNASVIKNGVLCLMALNCPADFDNGDTVSLDNTNASRSNSKENHHFFPYSIHDAFGVTKKDINSLLNFAFISKRLNGHISNKKPSEYLAGYQAENPDIVNHLGTHFINQEAYSAALVNDFHSFINERGNSILKMINTLCRVDDGVNTISASIVDTDYSDYDDDSQELSSDSDNMEQIRPLIKWLIPSNKKYFDLEGCLKKYGFVYWRRYFNYQDDDIVYIYSSKPDARIRYKLVVEDALVENPEKVLTGDEFYTEDNTPEYWKNTTKFSKFRLLEETNSEYLEINQLLQNGLNHAPQGAVCLSGHILEYIEDNFNK